MAAFRRAAAMGAQWIETDVCLLGDGTPILFHDHTFERTIGLSRKVREAEWAEVRHWRSHLPWDGDPALTAIPRLDEALQEIHRLGLSLNLELKIHDGEGDALVEAALPLLRKHADDGGSLLISSFEHRALEQVREQQTDWDLGYLCAGIPPDWQAIADELRLASFHPEYRSLTAARAQAVLEAGYELYAYTPNRAEEVTDLRAWGVTGVITDDVREFADWKEVFHL